MKIFITGCAGTRTTMVRNLMTAFEGVVISHEIKLTDFITHPSPKYGVLVGKRSHKDLIANEFHILKPDFEKQLELVKRHDIGIIITTRKKEDVLASKGGNYVSEERYNAVEEQMGKFILFAVRNGIRAVTIDTDYVIKDPNAAQQLLMREFSLRKEHNWFEYPNFVDDKFIPDKSDPRYSLRPLGADY